MRNKTTEFKGNTAGFSLVELLVVVAIVGILSSIAVPRLTSFGRRSGSAEAKANLGLYGQAAKTFFATESTYNCFPHGCGWEPESFMKYNYSTFGRVTESSEPIQLTNGSQPANDCKIGTPSADAKGFVGTACRSFSDASDDHWALEHTTEAGTLLLNVKLNSK